MAHEIKVRIPGDVRQLMDSWFVTIEPPYWYLRCRFCDLRRHLPWDARWRTDEALKSLLTHSQDCRRNRHDVEQNRSMSW
jgi:hypothetical protein